ncbi:MAG TPA: GDSL-type esterase/lipase family protein [Negativicutes bacterium]|nr:GDSL-type esterase/lipase family protein [Negativicutes bacterium]
MKKLILPITLLTLAAVALTFALPLGVTAKQSATAITAWADNLVRKPDDPPYMSIHWRLRELYFEIDPSPAHPVVFLGDSITYGGDWPTLFPDSPVENRGIGGDSTRGMLRRLDQVIELKPSQIFLMIGTNDLCYNRKIPDIIVNYRIILGRLRGELPDTRIYIQSVLPFNDEMFPARNLRSNANIAALNVEIRKLAAEYELPYIDLASVFTGPDGRLPAKYTDDGLHLSETAYLMWRDQIKHLIATGKKI